MSNIEISTAEKLAGTPLDASHMYPEWAQVAWTRECAIQLARISDVLEAVYSEGGFSNDH